MAVRREQGRPERRATLSEDSPRPEIVPMASKAQREGITTLRVAPALAMRFTGRMAPENNTAGTHNIGRARVA
jgi:hypothetical protein